MKDIMANEKLTAEERLNSIFDMQILFDKLTKKTRFYSTARPAMPAFEPSFAALQMQLNI